MINKRIVDSLEQIQPNKSKLVKDLETLLLLSNRAVYNRLQHNTPFSSEEIRRIIHRYELDPSKIFAADKEAEPQDVPTFKNASAHDFVKSLMEQWLLAVRAPLDKPQYRFFIVTNDLPILLAMRYPELIKCKIYLLAKYQWQHPDFEQRALQLNDPIYDRVATYSQQIHEIFSHLPFTGIWGTSTFLSVGRKISYLRNKELLSGSDAEILCKSLNDLLARSERFAENGYQDLGRKNQLQSDQSEFQLVYNDLFTVDEYTVLNWRSETGIFRSTVYHPIFGFLESPTQKAAVEKYLLQLINTGKSLSGNNDVEMRKAYFEQLRATLSSI